METLGLGLALAVGLLLVKEAGLPVPVPGDLIVVGLGVAAAQGRFDAPVALVAAIVATVVGGSVQFVLVRGPGRSAVLRLLGRFGIAEERIERQAERIRRRGAVAVALARMTPGVRIVAIAAAGLAAIPFARFVAGLSVGNALFVAGHFALGFAFGAAAGRVVAGLAAPLLVVTALALVGLVGWQAIRARRSAPDERGAWLDAACPACLAIGAVRSPAS